MRRLRIELRAVCLLQAGGIARIFNGGTLHSQANAEERNLVIAGELDRMNHALNPTLPEASRNQDPVIVLQPSFGGLQRIDLFGLNPVNDRLLMVSKSAMQQ